MKALSLRQPWAWLVVHAGKHIENRRWNTRFRGQFLIHAAKGMTVQEYADAVKFARDAAFQGAIPPAAEIERGGIVGVATIFDVIPPCSDARECLLTRSHRWHMPEQFGFVLRGVTPVPFRALKGSLGFFEVATPQLVFGNGAPVGWTA